MTAEDLVNFSVTSQTAAQYKRSFDRFTTWLAKGDHNFPKSFSTLVINFDLIELTNVFREYFTWRFNTTGNIGDSLRNEFSGILHNCQLNGLYVNGDWFPGVSKIFKGANRYAKLVLGKRVRQGKRALLFPMLKAMCEVATDLEKAIILVAHQGMLRSEHYADKGTGNKFLRMCDIRFEPDNKKPKFLVLWGNADKNHPFAESLQRTLPCRCKSNWPCAVHAAFKVIRNDIRLDNEQFLQGRDGVLSYSTLQTIVRQLCGKVGLNSALYGSHSLRAGGATEAFMEGKDTLWIQNFGHWEGVDSVKGYIRPRNPEIYKFVNSIAEYQILRKKEGSGMPADFKQVETVVRARAAAKAKRKRKAQAVRQQIIIAKECVDKNKNKGVPCITVSNKFKITMSKI